MLAIVIKNTVNVFVGLEAKIMQEGLNMVPLNLDRYKY